MSVNANWMFSDPIKANMVQVLMNRRQYLELEKIAIGAFRPLSGFMNEDEFMSVVESMRLPNGALFSIPVVLDLTSEQTKGISVGTLLKLIFENVEVGELCVKSVYRCDKLAVTKKVFGTSDARHPGVAHYLRMGEVLIGGPVRLVQRVHFEFSEYELTPDETRAYFAGKGWRTVVGFQTRNVPHRAHEYLLRLALEQSDGLFIQPLVGWRKRGDYNPLAILAAYRTLVDRFLPKERVLLGVLSTEMRYAGPREALFHAMIRRNYGCTHFIIGRDHAGVGDYYGKYDAHELAGRLDGELGIQILRFHGPFYCRLCGGIVTERSCSHLETAPEATHQISGTDVRTLLSQGKGSIPEFIMRREILESLSGLSLFIEEDDE